LSTFNENGHDPREFFSCRVSGIASQLRLLADQIDAKAAKANGLIEAWAAEYNALLSEHMAGSNENAVFSIGDEITNGVDCAGKVIAERRNGYLIEKANGQQTFINNQDVHRFEKKKPKPKFAPGDLFVDDSGTVLVILCSDDSWEDDDKKLYVAKKNRTLGKHVGYYTETYLSSLEKIER
jgi:hypothetical protein